MRAIHILLKRLEILDQEGAEKGKRGLETQNVLGHMRSRDCPNSVLWKVVGRGLEVISKRWSLISWLKGVGKSLLTAMEDSEENEVWN